MSKSLRTSPELYFHMAKLSHFCLHHYHLVQHINMRARSPLFLRCYIHLTSFINSSSTTKCCTNESLCLKSDPFAMLLCTSSSNYRIDWMVSPTIRSPTRWPNSMSNQSPPICILTLLFKTCQGKLPCPTMLRCHPKTKSFFIFVANVVVTSYYRCTQIILYPIYLKLKDDHCMCATHATNRIHSLHSSHTL
jgi:hypothetical protein